MTEPLARQCTLTAFWKPKAPVGGVGAIMGPEVSRNGGGGVRVSWKAGGLATSHDVYLGDNFDDVNDGIADVFRGNQADTFFIAGFPGFAFPDGLVNGRSEEHTSELQ